MPTLTWIGKDKVVNHHHDVPYFVLEKTQTFRTGQDRTGQDRTGQDRTGQDRTGQELYHKSHRSR